VALDSLPNFKCLPTVDGKPGPQHRGTIHINSETCEQIETAYRDCAINGIASRSPVIEMTLPSVLDPTLAPAGKHVASLFCQYAPYNLPGGWTKGAREDFAKTVFGSIEEYCPGFTKSVLYADILPPPDLERVFGLTGGNIFHHSMGLDQVCGDVCATSKQSRSPGATGQSTD
jgi:phytoene dehydrogenase-like protein